MRVERDEHEPERRARRGSGARKRKNRKSGARAALGRDVDVGSCVGGRQRVDLREQLGRRRERAAHAAEPVATATAATAAAHAQLARAGLRVDRRSRLRGAARRRRARRHAAGVMPSTLTGSPPSASAPRRRCPRRRRRARRAACGTAQQRADQLVVRAAVDAPARRRRRRCGRRATSVERRCAIRIVVRPTAIRRSVAWISSSTRASTDEVASSSSRMLRVGQQRPRERDALPLPAREREALLADDGVVAVRAAA